MKNRSKLLTAILGIACIALMIGATDLPKRQSWEYKSGIHGVNPQTATEFDRKLSALGSDGWELVTADRHEVDGMVLVIFKRPKQ